MVFIDAFPLVFSRYTLVFGHLHCDSLLLVFGRALQWINLGVDTDLFPWLQQPLVPWTPMLEWISVDALQSIRSAFAVCHSFLVQGSLWCSEMKRASAEVLGLGPGERRRLSPWGLLGTLNLCSLISEPSQEATSPFAGWFGRMCCSGFPFKCYLLVL